MSPLPAKKLRIVQISLGVILAASLFTPWITFDIYGMERESDIPAKLTVMAPTNAKFMLLLAAASGVISCMEHLWQIRAAIFHIILLPVTLLAGMGIYLLHVFNGAVLLKSCTGLLLYSFVVALYFPVSAMLSPREGRE